MLSTSPLLSKPPSIQWGQQQQQQRRGQGTAGMMHLLKREEWLFVFYFIFFQMALSSVRCWAPFRAATTFAVCQGDDEDVWTSLPPSLKHLQGSYSFSPLRCQTSSCAARVTGNTVHPVSAPEKSKESQKKKKKRKSLNSDLSGNVCGSDPTFEFTKSPNWREK